jgi:ribosomal protein S18 acetylase RimI-like enzyme
MQEIRIRIGESRDIPFLVECNLAMALETEGKSLDSGVLARGVGSLLERPQLGAYWIAEVSSLPAGCLMVTTEWSDWRNGLFWWIQSVYVKPAFRRRGIYRSLYRHVQSQARLAADVIGFRLYVEKENAAAQAAYRSLGMAETGYLLFEEMRG